MDIEPQLIKKQSSDLDPSSLNKDIDHLPTDDEDPYSFSSTSNSLIGLAIVFLTLGIPLIAVISERPETKKKFNTDFYKSKWT
tara:strand:- start:508 stop:756 length:249 start_codon:yes stop_codon:yes gene_type:complete